MALVESASAALYLANGDGAETTRRGHQLSMTSTVLTRCIRLLPGCESRLKSRLRHKAQVPGKSRYRTCGLGFMEPVQFQSCRSRPLSIAVCNRDIFPSSAPRRGRAETEFVPAHPQHCGRDERTT